MSKTSGNEPLLSTVLLSWNRIHLLQRTVESYLRTVSVPYELIIVDNGSTDGAREFIESVCRDRANHRAIMLDNNIGGEALNAGLTKARGEFLHISANDMEYLPGWDTELLRKFDAFPELGQISPISPFHEIERGEIWVDKPAIRQTVGESTIYVALANVGDTSILRRQIWNSGVRWQSLLDGSFKFPADGLFSNDVKRLGYTVAWNDRYLVGNLGHNVSELKKRLNYYVESAADKQHLGLEGLITQLHEHGYRVLFHQNGSAALRRIAEPEETVAYRKREQWKKWMNWLLLIQKELVILVPEGACYILVDDSLFGENLLPHRQGRPFLERGGEAWGVPADSETAIAELERMRREGASFLIFLWPAFWWLKFYDQFDQYLRAHFRCVLENELRVVFELG